MKVGRGGEGGGGEGGQLTLGHNLKTALLKTLLTLPLVQDTAQRAGGEGGQLTLSHNL